MRKTERSFNSTLRRESKKRQRLNRVRNKITADLKNQPCAICGKKSDDTHERLARSGGGSITNLSNLVRLCRTCHDWITHDVAGIRWAIEHDLVISRHDVRAKELRDGKTADELERELRGE